jgi:hypothetical protein
MREHKELTDYLAIVTQRLIDDGFKISEHITYKNQIFICVAKRTRWQLEHYGFAEFFFIFARFQSFDIASLKNFSAKAFDYSKKFRSIPLPRGLFESVICFPTAIVDSIDSTAVEVLRSKDPPKHWAAIEMAVVYEHKSRKLYYLEKTPYWGSLYWDRFREIIVSMLSP